MNDLSVQLNDLPVGCCLNGVNMNHLLYADDMVLIAPSPDALQKLIYVCEKYADSNFIKYNSKKTVCMCIKPKWLKNMFVPNFTLNGECLKMLRNKNIWVC